MRGGLPFDLLLDKLLVERGWTQVELAERSGVSRVTLSKLLNGRNDPALGTLMKLARTFGVDFIVTGSAGVRAEAHDLENV